MFFFNKKEPVREIWEEVNLGQVKGWQCTPFLKSPNVKHLFTGKSGDFNLAKHRPTVFPDKGVDKNRETLCKLLSINYENLVVLPLTHSDTVLDLKYDTKEILPSDAVITTLTNIPLLVTYADCVPILLYAEDKKVLGIVHAGWKGTAANIVEKTVLAMSENYQVRPSQITAAIGPAIGQKNYEVDEDVAKKLSDACESDEILDRLGKKPKADLKLANKLQLEKCGVMKIYVTELDTASNHAKLYSHRIQPTRGGRQGLIACLV
jgi:YfiH family protein